MSCYSCQHFSEFKEPRQFDGYTVYGKCFVKSELVHEQYPGGYNVYIPDGSCDGYKRDMSKPKEQPRLEEQIGMDDVFNT